MAKHLVIVESPAKAKTIGHYLGTGYIVQASVGHVRDLPEKGLGVDVEHAFAPAYEVSAGKQGVVSDIARAARGCEHIYLATDPDREGEAIAWHVAEAAQLDRTITQRIAFHQVTAAAVREALAHPRELDMDLVDAQQARRVLDRLVGYTISPLLSRAMHKRALSAGRVQSVALRLVVEREREILAFVPEEYWTLDALLRRCVGGKERFKARLVKIADQEPGLSKKEDVEHHLQTLERATYRVQAVRPGKRQRNPSPPFVTSTLQATASARLSYSPRQTMRLAQDLYEGIDLDGERVGLITYMRTDSTHVAPEAQQEAREYVQARWGPDYLPAQPPVYRSKVANAQEAHEAIRPTSVRRTPEQVRPFLDERQARLYELIWQRFLASQMAPAQYDTLAVDVLAAEDYLFRATGHKLIFAGFLAAYAEEDEDKAAEQEQELPLMSVGELLDLLKLLPEQHFTEPPPRYSEATLIRALEANGVGRPSTYASIIAVIQERDYVVKERGRLRPTELGMIVCDVLVAGFSEIMDVGYTAGMEAQLDQVAQGELGYAPMLAAFYGPFQQAVQQAKGALPVAVGQALQEGLAPELLERVCPQCGKPLQVRLSAAGRFLGCTNYPECRYVLDPARPEGPAQPEYSDQVCAKCGGRMRIITSGKNRFLGCENYPKCKNTLPILSEAIQALAQQTPCPQCSRPTLDAASGRYGEYLRCPDCKVNYSLAKLGLAPGKRGTGRGSRAKGDVSAGRTEPSAAESAQAAPETADVACPLCGHRPMESRVGRFGPYYRCPACKQNISRKKLAAAGG